MLKLQNQKSVVNDRFEQVEKDILREVREDYEVIFDRINPSTKNLHNINTLSDADRKKAFKWGDKYGAKEIIIHNN